MVLPSNCFSRLRYKLTGKNARDILVLDWMQTKLSLTSRKLLAQELNLVYSYSLTVPASSETNVVSTDFWHTGRLSLTFCTLTFTLPVVLYRTQIESREELYYNYITYYIVGNIRPRFIFVPFALVVTGRFKDWANFQSPTISFVYI